MDGTMSIISQKDYQTAISSGNDQTVVEIPKTPLPIKATNTAHRAANGEKKKRTVSPSEAFREDSIDTDAANKTEPGGATASDLRSRSSKSPAAKSTTSKLKHPERDSSEYETSGEDESSEIDDRPRPSRDSTVRSPMVEKSRPRSSVDSTFKAPTIKPPTSSNFKGAGSSSFNKIDHENSEDEMEDWEIKPGVVVGSGSDNDSDSETEHSEFFLLAIRVSEHLLTETMIQIQPTRRSTSLLLKQALNSQGFIFKSFALPLDQLLQDQMFLICESAP
jgi:hypothetical protein